MRKHYLRAKKKATDTISRLKSKGTITEDQAAYMHAAIAEMLAIYESDLKAVTEKAEASIEQAQEFAKRKAEECAYQREMLERYAPNF